MAKKLPKDKFFADMARFHLALTFDDVRLQTGHSATMPDDVSLESRFSRHVPLKIPIVSAAMDTVTEHEMAIELAKLGGLGVIHRNFTPEQQATEVARVKRHLNARIEHPICVYEDQTVESILKMREQERYTFHTFPVVSREGKLVGILTRNDFDFCHDVSMLAQGIMTSQVITASPQTTVGGAYKKMQQEKKKVLPLVNKNGMVVGMYVHSDVNRIISGSHSLYNVDSNDQLRVAAAVGAGKDALARLEMLVAEGVDLLVLDTAHADTSSVIDTLKQLKKKSDLDVVAGNISEPESAKRLYKAGADGIKVGQGPGSICTTRKIAGIGCPQVTAVYNCARVVDVPVCADGGLRYSGDIPVAIGAGAQSVMMGGMLAGTKESPGTVETLEGRQWKMYRGMGSLGAMQENQASRERYRQGGKSQLIPEGVEGLVPYKGELEEVLYQYLGGLRRGMGYVGAATIQELREKANFWRITHAGEAESHPHDVRITKEAPNYSGERP